MSLFTRMFLSDSAVQLSASNAVVPAGVGSAGSFTYDGIASTTPNSLNLIALSEVFPGILGDGTWLPLTTADAWNVPSVAAALNLVGGQISRQPLKVYKDGAVVETQPTFLYRTNGAVSPIMRTLFTIHDLILTGESLWLVTRGTDGAVTDAARVPRERWTTDSKGQILIDNHPVEGDSVIYFYGPVPGGLITSGARTLRKARDVENISAARVRNPAPAIHVQVPDTLTDEEMVDVKDRIVAVLREAQGGVVVTTDGITATPLGDASVDLLIEQQNSIAVNVAQILGVPAVLLDASPNSGNAASLTYQNVENARSWWLDTGFSLWASAISSRLSMDDVTPRGTYVDFDLTSLITIPQTGDPTVRED